MLELRKAQEFARLSAPCVRLCSCPDEQDPSFAQHGSQTQSKADAPSLMRLFRAGLKSFRLPPRKCCKIEGFATHDASSSEVEQKEKRKKVDEEGTSELY